MILAKQNLTNKEIEKAKLPLYNQRETKNNKLISRIGIFGLLVFFSLSFSSCTVVKEYQKVYINDPDMLLSASKMERFETNFQVYREAAAGANGGKSGGGCGCN